MSIKLGLLASSQQQAAPLLLDVYPGAAAAYSLRKLRTAYTGNCIRVQRSSDNTQIDIGFINNVLDTSTLLTFCGAGNGIILVWYDQSGFGNNLTQIQPGSLGVPPTIVNAGSLYLINGKPTAFFNNFNILQNSSINISQPNTIITLTQPNSTLNNSNLFDGLTTRQAIYANGSNRISFFAGIGQSSGISWGTTARIILAIFNAASSLLYQNNNLLLTANTGTNGLNGITLGGYPGGLSYWTGYIPEFIIYNINQSANISGIQTNINSYYTIY